MPSSPTSSPAAKPPALHRAARALWGSMTGRVWLLLLAGIALSVALTLWLAWRDKSDTLRQTHQAAHVERLAPFAQALASTTPEGRPAVLALGARMGLLAAPASAAQALQPAPRLSQQLSEAIGQPAKVWRGEADACETLQNQVLANAKELPRHAARRHKMPHDCFAAQWPLPDGTPATFLLLPPRGAPFAGMLPLPFNWGGVSPWRGWLGLGSFALCLFGLAWLITKLALRPLQTLTRAVQGFAQNVEQGDLAETGPREIRSAMRTFNQMQHRIRENLAQRTQMMAAITHDLQTPLTRMRLRLEKVEDPTLREKLLEDWQDAQARIHEGLELARSLDEQEPMQTVDIASLVESVCSDAADAGQAVVCQPNAALPANLTVRARPAALMRCVENLLGNAVRYGAASHTQPVQVTLAVLGSTVEITVRDHGAGIPDSELEAVFEPFKRLETSRSRALGGSGLGLAIVRNLMTRQGGSVVLANHPEGGLVAQLRIGMA